MEEKILSPLEQKRLQDQSETNQLADYLLRYPNPEPLPPHLIEQAKVEFDSLVASFESKYSLVELNSIIDLTPQEATNHPLREPARVALIEIVKILNRLKVTYGETSLEYQSIKANYMRLSRAVGIINKNKVDHDR